MSMPLNKLIFFCEGGKLVLFIFADVGRSLIMAGFTLYYVPLK